MKLNFNIAHGLAVASLLSATLLFTGCASTPADRAVDMASSVTKTSRQLEASKTAVTQVLTSLNQLVTQPSGDMRGQYKDYLGSVKNLLATSGKVDATINSMVDASTVYFADWGNQVAAINDPTLKQLSADRKQQAVTSLADLKASVDKARAAYKPLAKDLDDVGIYLGNNLTSDGIAAMKPRLDTIKVEALNVRDAVTAVVTSLSKFSGTLAQPAPGK